MKVIHDLRQNSLNWISNELVAENKLIESGLFYSRRQIGIFNRISHEEQESAKGVFARICSAGVAKAHRLLIGLYELNLLGLAQESGALLRPAIEIIEKLLYFNEDPERVYQVVNESLPSAGNIAKKIKGQFQGLRDYLNENASHFSFSEQSLIHIVDMERILTIADPKHSIRVFRANFVNILLFQNLLVRAACECLLTCGVDIKRELLEIEEWDNETGKILRQTLKNQ